MGDTYIVGKSKPGFEPSNKLKNFVGEKFGTLTVIELLPASADWITNYKCLCDCGRERVVKATNLNRGRTKSCSRCPRIKNYTEAAFNKVYLSYSNMASKRGLCFELTKEDVRILTSRNCFYCGVEPGNLSKSKYGTGSYSYNGIDRMNNEIGYIKQNVVPCCKMCNFAKGKNSFKDFRNYLVRIKFFEEGIFNSGSLSDYFAD